jgi:PAS domain S-box-containing protein
MTADYTRKIAPMALLEATLESIMVTTADLESPGPTIVYVNPAFERMTGWSKEEIVGQSPRVLQGPSTDLSVFDDLKPRLLRGETWQARAVNYRKDGQEFIMEWSIAPIRDDRNVISQYVAVQRDVTERVETERKLERARETVVDGLRKRELLHEMFGKFIPNAIVDRVIADAGILKPDLREATVFFSDIAGFTMLTESMDPRSILSLLNEYFSLVTSPIESRGGVIHHAANAVAAALEIQDTLGTYRFGNGSTLSTRIGINTGTVVAGTVGSSGRLGYTVHGDAVNLAARIEQENKRLGTKILIAEATKKEIGDGFECRAVETISVRGRRQPVTIYAVR